MSDNTKISWSDATWNPVSGCTEVSPGCAHCYAKTFAERWRGIEGHYYENGFDVQLRPSQLVKPLRWTRPRRIFVNSMSDLFHEDVPDWYIDQVFAVMVLARQHTFQVLTKRIERCADYLTRRLDPVEERHVYLEEGWRELGQLPPIVMRWPLPNVLIGPTVENGTMATKRLPVLAQIKAFGWRTMVSYEPALGPVDFLGHILAGDIDWLICGGESGSGRRPFDYAWARKARDDAAMFDVPFFMKQDGALRSEVYDTLPEDLKVREFPL